MLVQRQHVLHPRACPWQISSWTIGQGFFTLDTPPEGTKCGPTATLLPLANRPMPIPKIARTLLEPRRLLPFQRWTRRARLRSIHRSVQPLHGSRAPKLAPEDAVVLCVVRNGESWITDFISHHLDIGFRHLVFLDNGSTDETVELARRDDSVTMLRTDLPFRGHNTLFRRYLVERFGRGRWSLTVDIDEFWDYPFSSEVTLGRFFSHLREQGNNAVVAHMLDLFAPELPEAARPLDFYRHYDLSAITRDGLDCDRGFRACGFDAIVPGSTSLGLYRGGIRAQVFGLSTVWLSKMPLLYFDEELDPLVHQHFSRRGRIAKTSTVLCHYKFIHTFRTQVAEALRRKQHFRNSWDYLHYRDALRREPNPDFMRPTTRSLRSVDQLVDEGFLAVSDAYRRLVSDSAGAPGITP